jgi:hypothetical protein
MENSTATIEKLIEKAEIYSKTMLELYKYNTVYKSTDIFSDLSVKLAITIVAVISSFFANIGLALWIGSELGETYYGFFVIAFAYLLFLILIYILRNKWIKIPVSNFIINKIINEKEDENGR